MLANIIAHVGNLDKSRRRGGNLLLCTGDLTFPACINRSSDTVMNLLSFGSFDTLNAHERSHNIPSDEKTMKGPEMPTDESMIGVTSRPATLPR